MHAVWKGTISFGLVAIPVQLFAATEERGVSFHQVHTKDGGRIRYRKVCTVDGDEVPYADIAKGYTLPTGEVVVLREEDFANLPLATHRAIEVLSFVAADDIDTMQLSRSYYCAPTSADIRPYALLREAMARTGKVAMVKVALRQRESLAMLRPRGRVLVLHLLLWPSEVREPRFPFLDADVRLQAKELEIAESYVEVLTGEVDKEETVDRYRVALEQLIESKATGALPPPVEPVSGNGKAVDLMEALRRTVEEAQRTRGRPTDAGPSKRGLSKKGLSEKGLAEKGLSAKAPAKKAMKGTASAGTKKRTTPTGGPAGARGTSR